MSKQRIREQKIDKLGRVSTESVKKHTGRSWTQWVTLLDQAGAQGWPHREIALLLKTKHKLTPWWQHGVAYGYEIHHGRRVEGRNEKGEYATVATKTLPVSAKAAWKLVTSPAGMQAWLRPFSPFPWKPGQGFEVEGGIFGEIRTMKAGVRARLTWQEAHWARPSVLQLHVVPRKGEKSVFVVSHEQIPGAALRGRLREQWKESLSALAELLESQQAGRKGR